MRKAYYVCRRRVKDARLWWRHMQDQNIDPTPSPHPYRCAIRDTAAGVHCSKSSAAQYGSHLVNLFKGLLFHFDCKKREKRLVKHTISIKKKKKKTRGQAVSYHLLASEPVRTIVQTYSKCTKRSKQKKKQKQLFCCWIKHNITMKSGVQGRLTHLAGAVFSLVDGPCLKDCKYAKMNQTLTATYSRWQAGVDDPYSPQTVRWTNAVTGEINSGAV